MGHADDETAGIRAELREMVKAMAQIREELVTLQTDMEWMIGIVGDVCDDVDELKAFRWRVYGISAGISSAISMVLCFVKG